jgi:hypothetical protein
METEADGDAGPAGPEPGSDAALLAEGWATLTPLAGVREDRSEQGDAALAAALGTYRPGVLDGR